MDNIEYVKLNDVDKIEFIRLLNKKKIREHLISHELFDSDILNAWIVNKSKMDASPGCKVRAVLINKKVAGWCGIQCEDEKYEIAIVIDERYWGVGPKIFRELMGWAQDLGHESVCVHFLSTRPEYKFLRKTAISVYESELLGSQFTTYELKVEHT